MASFNKFNTFVADIHNKVHNIGSDQLKLALTNSLPVAGNTVLANITEITYTNLSTRNVTTTTSTQSSGTYKLIVVNPVLTSTGGTTGPFRYVVLYNSTAAGGPLIGWYDYGSSVTMNDGDTFTVSFDATNGVWSTI